MARGAIVYRTSLELSLVDRGQYARLNLRVARHPSETVQRMLVRILAYAIRYEEGLAFGRGVSSPEEADVWSHDASSRVQQWIEVGQPEARRLLKVARQAEAVYAFVFGRGSEAWRDSQFARLDVPANLHVCRILDDFVEELATHLLRKVEWALTLSEGVLYLDDGARNLETTPLSWWGEPLR